MPSSSRTNRHRSPSSLKESARTDRHRSAGHRGGVPDGDQGGRQLVDRAAVVARHFVPARSIIGATSIKIPRTCYSLEVLFGGRSRRRRGHDVAYSVEAATAAKVFLREEDFGAASGTMLVFPRSRHSRAAAVWLALHAMWSGAQPISSNRSTSGVTAPRRRGP